MEQPGEAVLASKEGKGSTEAVRGGWEGGRVEGREMQAVLGQEGSDGGKEGIGGGGKRQAVKKSLEGVP